MPVIQGFTFINRYTNVVTTTSLSINSSNICGQTNTFNITVTGTITPQGNVQIINTANNSIVATVALSGGTATFTNTLFPGNYSYRARYLSNTTDTTNWSGSDSSIVNLSIIPRSISVGFTLLSAFCRSSEVTFSASVSDGYTPVNVGTATFIAVDGDGVETILGSTSVVAGEASITVPQNFFPSPLGGQQTYNISLLFTPPGSTCYVQSQVSGPSFIVYSQLSTTTALLLDYTVACRFRPTLLKANVQSAIPGIAPTGTVSFFYYVGSSTVLIGTASVVGGLASFTWTPATPTPGNTTGGTGTGLSSGTYLLRAVYTPANTCFTSSATPAYVPPNSAGIPFIILYQATESQQSSYNLTGSLRPQLSIDRSPPSGTINSSSPPLVVRAIYLNYNNSCSCDVVGLNVHFRIERPSPQLDVFLGTVPFNSNGIATIAIDYSSWPGPGTYEVTYSFDGSVCIWNGGKNVGVTVVVV